jgi:SHS2 domain-containing protein
MTTHEFLDHTSETVLRVRAPDLPALFAEAARALGQVERGGIAGTGERVEQQVSVESADPAGLLVDWLNEVIWLSETGQFVPESVRIRLQGDTALTATLGGERLKAPPSLVKAATRHALRLERTPSGWIAEVTLDV